METSDDDTGSKTHASRLELARETELGQMEDVNATGSVVHQEASEAKQPGASAPEDHFDVGTLSAATMLDSNTSTEALLEMIDEIVDGPKSAEPKPPDTHESSGGIAQDAPDDPPEGASDPQETSIQQPEGTSYSETGPSSAACTVTNDSNVNKSDNDSSVSAEPGTDTNVVPNEKIVTPESNVDTIQDAPVVTAISNIAAKDQTDQLLDNNDVNTNQLESKDFTIRPTDCSVSDPIAKTSSCEKKDGPSNEKINMPSTISPLKRRLVRPPRLERVPTPQTSPAPVPQITPVPESSTSDSKVNVKDSESINETNVKTESPVTVPKKIKLIRNKIFPSLAQKVTTTEVLNQTSTPILTQEPSKVKAEATSDTSPNKLETSLVQDNTAIKNDSHKMSPVRAEPEHKTPHIEPVTSHDNLLNMSENVNDVSSTSDENDISQTIELRKVPPIKLNIPTNTVQKTPVQDENNTNVHSTQNNTEVSSPARQVPKLTIKLSGIQTEDTKCSVPKVTIKPLVPPSDTDSEDSVSESNKAVPCVTKLNIKPIQKPSENDMHRKSSSSDISESESSENDESTSASTSDQGPSETVPKMTIKLGKLGSECESKIYVQPNVSKSMKTASENCEEKPGSNIKLKVTQSQEKQHDKIPKLTIKPVTKTDGQPMSPKLNIKPLKPPENFKEITVATVAAEVPPIPKLKITQEQLSPREIKENFHIPKLTIKPVLKKDSDQIPTVTKLNIKPLIKPTDCGNDGYENNEERVPVVSKLNIKPVIKPKDNDEVNLEHNIPKITKLNIKPIKSPPEHSSNHEDSKDWNSDCHEKDIPFVTKINIKPVIKPVDEEASKDSENQSSETGNSSDENSDSIPVVTKLNIKPIVKPNNIDITTKDDMNIPIVTKLNIKPILKPEEKMSSSSPKKDNQRPDNIPVVMKLNIKPVVKPDHHDSSSHENIKEPFSKPPLVMKINIKAMNDNSAIQDGNVSIINNIDEHSSCNSKVIQESTAKDSSISKESITNEKLSSEQEDFNNQFSDESSAESNSSKDNKTSEMTKIAHDQICNKFKDSIENDLESQNTNLSNKHNLASSNDLLAKSGSNTINEDIIVKPRNVTTQGCALLKKLLEDNSVKKMNESDECVKATELSTGKVKNITKSESTNEHQPNEHLPQSPDMYESKIENSTVLMKDFEKPLEINTNDKIVSSGQDSPRIILKINKTEQGASAKIITEEILHSDTNKDTLDKNSHADKQSQKKLGYGKRKSKVAETLNTSLGKRLRSSRVVQETDQSQLTKQIINSEEQTKLQECESPEVEPKKHKYENEESLLVNTSEKSDTSKLLDTENINDTLTKTEHNSDSNSKLHKILFHLQAKQLQSSPKEEKVTDISKVIVPENDSTTSTGSSEVADITAQNSHSAVQEMLINESSHDFSMSLDDIPRDPLEMDTPKSSNTPEVPEVITPQPKKRGRPRKQPLPENVKPAALPVPALEERPQRSLRLSRERPAVVAKPRGRGRGRGVKRMSSDIEPSLTVRVTPINIFTEEKIAEDEDPMSSRVKLPRMTEALNKSTCSTPLSRRRESSYSDSKQDDDDTSSKFDDGMRSPEPRGPRGRGSRGGRGRTPGRSPRNRGRGRGGGRGAVYMKETMGIYGRVCGPATTTVQLFEEETCMMDDNATPAKPVHLLDEDSQSSVKSSTNDSCRAKKSKFAELFDSNKLWTAADVKEYTWPLSTSTSTGGQVMMIQEQVAMFLGVKSFKRRYPELKRRTVTGDEKDYVLQKGIVTEALCDLGITAVDASDVLDIMLSDYPHKYEEYRAHQRERQRSEESSGPIASEPVERIDRVEMKIESKSTDQKAEQKIDPEKLRQDMAAAAVAAASEFNTRLNALRRTACVDLQSLQIHRRRPPPTQVAPPQVVPPSGLYPHALLPGQYQHCFRKYTPQQLRYFPLNTALEAPPAPESPEVSESESEDGWGTQMSTSEDSDNERSNGPKRRKPVKVKRSSHSQGASKDDFMDTSSKDHTSSSAACDDGVEKCRVCGLKEEANRKYSHERFLACAQCHAKLHPSCLELGADTIRKCREYPWQCAECKMCCGCQQPADDDKMLFCDLCDRGFHIYCVGLDKVPTGRWHCVECAICKSCGAREACGMSGAEIPGLQAEWHHQSKRGPGGHKVYSHSLCTPCARAYRIGRYCPLCERSFIGPKGTMQLVICKLCDRQLHQDCVKQTVTNLNVMDYTCGECRRGGITSRAAAARLAPRTIATLFMAKRRFNKYAHRQYMASRQQGKGKPGDDAAPSADSGDTSETEPLEGLDMSRADSLDDSAAVDEEPAPLDTEPAALDEEPATLDEEPATLDEETDPLDEKPTPLDEEPAALDEPPALPEDGMDDETANAVASLQMDF